MIPISNIDFVKIICQTRPVATVSWHFPGRQTTSWLCSELPALTLLALAITRITPQDEAWRRLSQILKNVVASNVDATVMLYTVSRTISSDATNIFYLET